MKCPCCGQQIEEAKDIMVNLERNEIAVAWSEQVVKLTARQAEVAAVLLKAMPRTVSAERLIRGVFGAMEHSAGDNNLRVHVMRLRKRIAPLGLKITTLHFEGYRMEKNSVENRGEQADTRRVDGLPPLSDLLLGPGGGDGKPAGGGQIRRVPADQEHAAISQG